MVKLQQSYDLYHTFKNVIRVIFWPTYGISIYLYGYEKTAFTSEVVSWCHVYLSTWLKSQQQKFQDIIYLLKKAIHFKTKRVKCLSKNLSKSKSIMLTRSIPTLPFCLCFIFCRKYKQLKTFLLFSKFCCV